MASFNRIVLVGKVSGKPDTKFGMDSTMSLAKFTLSVDRPPRQDGTIDQDNIPVVAFGKMADYVAEQVNTDALVGVEGRVQVKTVDKEGGQRAWITEVIASSVRLITAPVVAAAPVAKAPTSAGNPFDNVTEDDVPF